MKDINLEFPTQFLKTMQYPKENLKYSTNNFGTEKLFLNLLKASDYRCMYCGESLMKGNSHKLPYTFEKEHTIEKKQYNSSTKVSEELAFLKECKFNFSVTCDKCNSYKRTNQKFIDDNLQDTGYFDNYCSKIDCGIQCDFFLSCINDYICRNNFIIQPYGIYWGNPNSANLSKIIFNAVTRQFSYGDVIPDDIKDTISFHISKFQLNTRNLDILTTTIDRLYDRINEDEDISDFYKFKNSRGKHIYANILDEKFLNYIGTLNSVQIKMLVTLMYKRQMLLKS